MIKLYLRDTLKGKLVHQVDHVRLLQEAGLEFFHRNREGSGVQ